jgi:hypothetical protein
MKIVRKEKPVHSLTLKKIQQNNNNNNSNNNKRYYIILSLVKFGHPCYEHILTLSTGM